jgi:hypothetical protein
VTAREERMAREAVVAPATPATKRRRVTLKTTAI